MNWYAFFSWTDPVPAPSLKDFMACANIWSSGYTEDLHQYENLPVDIMRKQAVPNCCILLPSVAMKYLDNPGMSPLEILHIYLSHIFDRMPNNNQIILNEHYITLEEDEKFPDGAYYEAEYARAYYPSIVFLWYFWKRSFIARPHNLNVSRAVSSFIEDQQWSRETHEMWLWNDME